MTQHTALGASQITSGGGRGLLPPPTPRETETAVDAAIEAATRGLEFLALRLKPLGGVESLSTSPVSLVRRRATSFESMPHPSDTLTSWLSLDAAVLLLAAVGDLEGVRHLEPIRDGLEPAVLADAAS